MFCPYYKNKTVFNEFNDIVVAFGGKPMTEEEFRSAELRNQRTGRDYSAMEAAYKAYDRNGGNGMNYTPLGEQSQLFLDLLTYYNGDMKAAIVAKSNLYSDKYTSKNGVWYSGQNITEPSFEQAVAGINANKELQIRKENASVLVSANLEGLGIEITEKANNDGVVSSQELVQQLLSNNYVRRDNLDLFSILQRHNIPIVFDDQMESNKLATSYTDQNGITVIAINPKLMREVSFGYFSEAVAHEMMHAVTVSIINNPITAHDKQFARLNHEMWKKLSSFYSKNDIDSIDVDSALYALKNEKEFAAVFATDEDARAMLYKLAQKIDSQEKKGLFQKFKSFVTSLVRAISGRAQFSTQEQLAQYQKCLTELLCNQTPIDCMKSLDRFGEIEDRANSRMYENEALLEKIKYLDHYSNALEQNDYIKTNWSEKQKADVHSFENAVKKLLVRQAALQTQNMDVAKKQKLLNELSSQLESLQNPAFGKYMAMNAMLDQILPQMLDDIHWLKTISLLDDKSISADEYMFQSHSNISLYENIVKEFSGILNQNRNREDLIQEHNSLVTKDDEKISEDDLNKLQQVIRQVLGVCGEANTALAIINNRIAQNKLLEKAKQVGATEEMEDFLGLSNRTVGEGALVNSIMESDISWLEQHMLSMDSSTNPALKTLYSLVNEAVERAAKKTRAKTAHLIELKSALRTGESVTDLYEKDEHGRTTGYFIRKLNFGRAYRDLEKEYKRINNLFNDVFSSVQGFSKLQTDNRCAPSDDTIITEQQAEKLGLPNYKTQQYSIRSAYNELINQWKAKNGHRRYKAEYYSAWNAVPKLAKDELDAINIQIRNITQSITDPDGIPRLENLSDEDYKKLLSLQIQKKLLYSEYDEFGNKKSGSELENAKALKKLKETLYGNQQQQRKFNWDAWNNRRNELIQDCGGQNAFDKYFHYSEWLTKKINECNLSNGDIDSNQLYNTYLKNKSDGINTPQFDAEKFEAWKQEMDAIPKFNIDKYNKWMSRNSNLVFKKNDDGKAKLFVDIENDIGMSTIDYGPEYKALEEEYQEKIKPFRDQAGIVIMSSISETLRNRLLDIQRQMNAIKKNYINQHGFQNQSQIVRNIWNTYVNFQNTEYFIEAQRQAELAATDEEGHVDAFLYEMYMENYGYAEYYDMIGGGIMMGDDIPVITPYKWGQQIIAKDFDTYMEWVPGNQFSEEELNSQWKDESFDESYNSAFVPDAKLYDNTTAFNKIQNSKSLAALYDASISTMKEANAMQKNRLYSDDYLMPQCTGSIWKRMKRHPFFNRHRVLYNYFTGKSNDEVPTDWGGVITYAVLEALGLKYNPDNDLDVGNYAALDQEEQYVRSKDDKIKKPIGVYPDGRSFFIIPQYYTRKLKDPSQQSSDLIRILTNYYKMSCQYEEKTKIKDSCESIVDFLYKRGEIGLRKEDGNIDGDWGNAKDNEYKSYKAAQKFLEMNLYNIRRSNMVFKLGPLKWNFTKFSTTWKNAATSKNLGCSPKVAITGFLSTMGEHIMNVISGQYYNFSDYRFGIKQLCYNIFKHFGGLTNISNKNSSDPFIIKMEYFNVADSADRKSENTNRNRLINMITENSIFGFLTAGDFLAKGSMMAAILHSYRFVDGQFLTKEDIRIRYRDLDKAAFKEKMREHDNATTLYDALRIETKLDNNGVKHRRIYLNPEHQQAFDDIEIKVRSTIQKLTAAADGMQTELQKSAMTQSIIGNMIMIHRQYLPVMLSKHFGKMVYDYDLQQYKGGEFRTLAQYIKELSANNLLLSMAVALPIGAAFGGTIGSIIAPVLALSFGIYGKNQNRKKGIAKKSIKQINKEFFGDDSTEMRAKRSAQNRRNIIQVFSRILIYYGLVSTITNLFCALANDDDDNKWLQLLALILRQFQWEYFSSFRTSDLINNIRTPTAGQSVVDGLENLTDMGSGLLWSAIGQMAMRSDARYGNESLSGLYNTPKNIYDLIYSNKNTIKSGTYKGKNKWFKTIMQLTPYHNAYEQYLNAKGKRAWLEHNTFKMKKEDNFVEYNPFTEERW